MVADPKALGAGEIPRRDQLVYTERYSREFLEQQRHASDPVADAVIAALKSHYPIEDPASMLTEVRRLAVAEGGVFQTFVDTCATVPEWADFQAMEAGQRLMVSAGPIMGLSILGIVVGSAWHVRAEPVFTATGRFVVEEGVAERLKETSAILGLVPLPGEIRPGGRHHTLVMKVRLLHGAIRHWIEQRGDAHEYDYARCGIPVNQEDLGYALLIFSYLNVRGMIRLGLRPSDEQVRSLQLLWRYIGWVVGVDERWLAKDPTQEREIYLGLLAHLSEPGVASIAALNLMDGAMTGVPRPLRGFAKRTLRSLAAHLGGDEYLSALRLDATGSRFGLSLLKSVGRCWNAVMHLPGGEVLLYAWGMRSLRRRYGVPGHPSERHGYGVVAHSPEAVDEAMARQRERLEHAA